MADAGLQWGAVLVGGLMLSLLAAGIIGWVFVSRDIIRGGFKCPCYVGWVAGRHWVGEDILWAGVCISSVLVVFYGMGLYLERADVSPHFLQMIAAIQNVFLQGMVLVVLYRRLRSVGSDLFVSFGIPEKRFGVSRRLFVQVFFGYVLCLPLVYLSAWFSQALFAGEGDGPIYQPVLVLLRDAASPLWFRGWIVGAAVLVAPVVEEAFFRGVLLPVFVRRYGVWPSLLLGGAIFGLVHGHLPAAFPLFVFGVGLGWSYLQTGNLLVPIGIHALFNAVNLLVVLLTVASSVQT